MKCNNKVKELVKMINNAEGINSVIGFNFPSKFHCGHDYEINVVNKINKENILRNVIIADEKVTKKYEVDALILDNNGIILLELKKNINNDGHKVSCFIADLLERKEILKPYRTILVTDSYVSETDLNRFKMANIEVLWTHGLAVMTSP